MQVLNQFGEPIYRLTFHVREQALRFCKMLGRNPRCFSVIGLHQEGGSWVLRYRSRKSSPWEPDGRATWPAGR